MELNKLEGSAIEGAVAQSTEKLVRELNEFQLALVGGGIGETIL